MTSPSAPDPPSNPPFAKPLVLCEHCEMLGASAVIQVDPELTDVIYCFICRLRFHVSTEGSRVIVLSVKPLPDDVKQ